MRGEHLLQVHARFADVGAQYRGEAVELKSGTGILNL